MISSKVVFEAGQILADFLAMLTPHWGEVPMQVLRAHRDCVPVDELEAHRAFGLLAPRIEVI